MLILTTKPTSKNTCLSSLYELQFIEINRNFDIISEFHLYVTPNPKAKQNFEVNTNFKNYIDFDTACEKTELYLSQFNNELLIGFNSNKIDLPILKGLFSQNRNLKLSNYVNIDTTIDLLPIYTHLLRDEEINVSSIFELANFLDVSYSEIDSIKSYSLLILNLYKRLYE